MILDLAAVATGAAVLAYAGDRLVHFASALALKARLTPAVIGLTIVAGGTSAPELVVSVTGALRGSPAIALGNVVGSNIANIALILGICGLIAPVPVARGVLRFEYPFLVLASATVLLLCRDGRVDRLEGVFLLGALVAFTAYAVRIARQEITRAEKRVVAEVVPGEAAPMSRRPTWFLVLVLLASLAGLVAGAQVLVGGAVNLARTLGVSERVVALTVVSVGTSLPELAVSLAAALRRDHAMAVANIVGSNIFNLLMILGAAALAQPLVVDRRTLSLDLWVMMGVTVILLPLVYRRGRLGRAGAFGLLATYAGYVVWLALSPA